MAKNINYTCDGCYKIISGHDRAAIVNRSHIQINGQMILQIVDPETGWRNHTFITPTPTENLSFCINEDNSINLDCLKSYIEQRLLLWNTRREAILLGGATAEEAARQQ